jgi:hypothetical protein
MTLCGSTYFVGELTRRKNRQEVQRKVLFRTLKVALLIDSGQNVWGGPSVERSPQRNLRRRDCQMRFVPVSCVEPEGEGSREVESTGS